MTTKMKNDEQREGESEKCTFTTCLCGWGMMAIKNRYTLPWNLFTVFSRSIKPSKQCEYILLVDGYATLVGRV